MAGVEFGDSGLDVLRKVGAPTDEADSFFPSHVRWTGPSSILMPPSDERDRTPPAMLHYRNYAYAISPTTGVFAMATFAPDARTDAGVGIGDSLVRVDEVYERVECGEAMRGESPTGNHDMYQWCRTQVGDVRLFFGGDPIESITVANTELG
jgi:hypothetical protein